MILPFVDYTGIEKKNHELYNKAVEVHLKKNNKASGLNLKKRKDNFQKSWATYQQQLTKYIDKKEQHEDEGVCVACAEMADKKRVCNFCSVCVHPVLPCSHTSMEKDLICDKCFQSLPTTYKPKHPAQENDKTTKLKDSPVPEDKPEKTPDQESVKEDNKVKDDLPVAEDRAELNLLEPENDEEKNDKFFGKKPEQENDETMPVDDNEAGGKKRRENIDHAGAKGQQQLTRLLGTSRRLKALQGENWKRRR
jgi:hypothetical protein